MYRYFLERRNVNSLWKLLETEGPLGVISACINFWALLFQHCQINFWNFVEAFLSQISKMSLNFLSQSFGWTYKLFNYLPVVTTSGDAPIKQSVKPLTVNKKVTNFQPRGGNIYKLYSYFIDYSENSEVIVNERWRSSFCTLGIVILLRSRAIMNWIEVIWVESVMMNLSYWLYRGLNRRYW